MKVLNHNDKEFLVAHFQSNSFDEFANTLGVEFTQRKIAVPQDVSIVTVATKNTVDSSPLIYQLNKNQTPYINTAAEHDAIFQGWSNAEKPAYILSALEKAQTKYALILDSRDVLIAGDLAGIFDLFHAYEKDVLFGATKSNHPNVCIDKVERRDWFGEFKYLNAGTAFGTVESLKKFYKLVAELEIDNPAGSEQFLVRHVFADNQDWVGFDYNCGIFQTFGKATVFHPDEKDTSIAKVV